MDERDPWFDTGIFQFFLRELDSNPRKGIRSFSTDQWEVVDSMDHWGGSLKQIIEQFGEKKKQEYNVFVYQVKPYPPGTKDAKDFYIQQG